MFDSSYDPAEHPYDDWLPDDVKMLGLVLELPSEEYRDVTLRYFVPYPYLRQRGGVLNLRCAARPHTSRLRWRKTTSLLCSRSSTEQRRLSTSAHLEPH
jgi:hypothetical protein